MTRLDHSVSIQQPLSDVYALCKQVERYPEFLPGYRKSRIISSRGDAFLLEREADVRGKRYRWTSWVRFEENEALHFEQAEGPLRGMRVTWRFYSMTPKKTDVVITHQFHLRRPWMLGFFIERFFFKPRLNAIASLVVSALKDVCEAQKPEAVSV